MLNNIKYKMIDSDGSIHFATSPKYNKEDFTNQLKHIKKYFDLDKHSWEEDKKTISFKRNGKKQNALILRLTSSGDKKQLEIKRIQIGKKDFPNKNKPEFIIAIYEFKNNILFVSTNNFQDFKFSSNNITTLSWVNFNQLEIATKKGYSISKTKVRKGVKYKVFVHKELDKLLDVLDEYKNSESDWLNDLEFEEEKVIKNNEIKLLQEDKELGRIGEQYFYDLCIKNNPFIKKLFPNFNFQNLIWLNKEKEKYKSWDFEYKDIIIEIKSSKKQNFFFLSRKEKNKMIETKNYLLIKLNNYNYQTKKFDEPIFYTKNALLKMNNEVVTYLFNEKKGQKNE